MDGDRAGAGDRLRGLSGHRDRRAGRGAAHLRRASSRWASPTAASRRAACACPALLEAAGFEAPVLKDIRSEIWLKLWGNLCFNPISALTRATLDIVATEPSLRTLSINMMTEAQEIATRFGATFRVDITRRVDGAARVGAHRTSMLQDLENGRPLEIDALLTSVQEMGRLVSVETPYIDMVLGLVQQLGRSLNIYPPIPGVLAGAAHGAVKAHAVPR